MLQYACLQYLGFPSVESQRQIRGDDLNAKIIYLELWMCLALAANFWWHSQVFYSLTLW